MPTHGTCFIAAAGGIFNLGEALCTQRRRFRAVFGAPASVVAIIWDRIRADLPRNGSTMHLLWALHFLKNYSTEHNNCVIFRCDEKTFRKWCWLIVKRIASTRYVSSIYF